ncbi:MAG: TraR/DksA C4-type zinc finger protein [Candidatus Pacebacteria bacterium]|nr:TraR/DksA C4-type zinc finger protein [Candidatus Paceibacterota bacterium]MBP9058311.1 TraR/DksA C4-type zinc finger protein [Candidatus Paceibacterota bacterium]MBP9770352.1 TraR/DksA C4-type zinc finger protein [Candidatus Paceibacterota bacterium]
MTTEKINELKIKLEEEKALLEKELSGFGKRNTETGDWETVPNTDTKEADSIDEADRDEDFEERAGKMEALEGRLLDIVSAIQKIDNGNFGICEVCEQEIEEDRLEANPSSKTCQAHM